MRKINIVQDRNSFLDYMRALAIIPVMLVHYRSMLVPGGSLGVNVFFCLSGYFIAHQLLDDRPWQTVLVSFLIRRMLRIVPLYVVVLALCQMLVETTGARDASFSSAWLMLNVPTATGYRMGFFWTLQVEFWFYILAPLVFLFTKNSSIQTCIVVSIFCISILASLYPDFLALSILPLRNLVFHGNNFMIGCLCAIAMKRWNLETPDKWAPFVISAAILVIVFLYCFQPDRGADAILRGTVVATSAGACILSSNTRFARALWIPSAAFIGLISYSLYLIHLPILDYLTAGRHFGLHLDAFWSGSAIQRHFDVYSIGRYLMICIMIASATWISVERPGQWLAKRLLRRQQKTAASRRPNSLENHA